MPRAKRGTVSLCSHRSMIRLRWRYAKQRYSLSPGLPDSPLHRHVARKLAAEIELDMATGHFDSTLAKYRTLPTETPGKDGPSSVYLFEQYIASRKKRGTSDYTLHNNYGKLLRFLQRWKRDITSPDAAAEFIEAIHQQKLQNTRRPISDGTLNRYLATYRRWGQWCVDHAHWASNHFRQLEAIRTHRSRESRRAFSDEERTAIIEGFQARRRHWVPYVMALFWLGFRPGELIGLRWRDVSLKDSTITIAEALARDVKGRRRKETKTGNRRTLTLNQGQMQIFTDMVKDGAKPDDLIFTAPRGGVIDDNDFCSKVWRLVLDYAGVEYRPPYACRHTFATWAKRNGMSEEQLAYWLGHKSTAMVREHYGHLDQNPKVPEF